MRASGAEEVWESVVDRVVGRSASPAPVFKLSEGAKEESLYATDMERYNPGE